MPSPKSFPEVDESADRANVNSSNGQPFVYQPEFFDYLEETSTRSARVIVPHVMNLFGVTSVVDVGCGCGAWLRTFSEHGVESIRGIDGSYVERNKLLIPEHYFTPMDLNGAFQIPGEYDLAVCLEVAEHLPAANAEHLVSQLARCAPLVLFSAAIPGQGGVHHINERFPSYWHELFKKFGHIVLDPIRPKIQRDRSVEFWYRQNIVVYASETLVASSKRLTDERSLTGDGSLEWVHVSIAYRYGSVRVLWRELLTTLASAVRRRAPQFIGRPGGEAIDGK